MARTTSHQGVHCRRCTSAFLRCIVFVVALHLVVSRGMAEQPAASADIDALAARELELGAPETWQSIDDERFLLRATLDVLGRQPTLTEQDNFARDGAADRRALLVDRLLADPGFGGNWANYWSDMIAYRVVPPAEVVIDYGPFKEWFAAEWNAGRSWQRIVEQILTATGRIAERPAVTYVTYHEAQPTKLAAETARVFLGQQIGCAECHDHPFDHWTRDEFHGFAAAFAQLEIVRRKGGAADGIKWAPGKNYRAPDLAKPGDKGPPLVPTSLVGEPLNAFDSRAAAARWLTSDKNPWFARAFVNQVWTRLMGCGLAESVETMRDEGPLPETHAALAEQFRRSDYNIRDCFRTLLNSRLYARPLIDSQDDEIVQPLRLRGDEVYDLLTMALGAELQTPPVDGKTTASAQPKKRKRKPKSERELLLERFGYDPALRSDQLHPTIDQALFLMNHPALQAAIDGGGEQKTMLSELLKQEPDDTSAAKSLYRRVLGREPEAAELSVFAEHCRELGNREEAFADLLWSLVNSTEFITRR